PDTLWRSDSRILVLPQVLVRVYRDVLDERGLRPLAESRSPDDAPIGGISKELTDRHFAHAFSGSTGRAQLAMLDPRGDIAHISNAFVRLFSCGRLAPTR